MKIIIDTDPGIDDALALALALQSPELQVLAVTTVYGNCQADQAFRNARHLVKRFSRQEVPVYPGADRPLARPLQPALETHGDQGLGNFRLPDSELLPEPRRTPAAVAITDTLAAAAEPVTLVCLGPLTNLALALRLNPQLLKDRLKRVVIMGGSVSAPGNVTPVSEFNFWADPEAAAAVLASGLPLTLVGLDVTRQLELPAAAVDKLAETPEHRFWFDLLEFYVKFHREYEGLEGCYLNDPLAVAILLKPELIRRQMLYAEVSLADGLTRGQLLADRLGNLHRPPNVEVALGLDRGRALAFCLGRSLGQTLTHFEVGELGWPGDYPYELDDPLGWGPDVQEE